MQTGAGTLSWSHQAPTFGHEGLADAACFAPGTLIETDSGFTPIEDLGPGDLVATLCHGLQPIRHAQCATLWMGHMAHHPHHRPIIVRAGALGQDLPWRDLIVSPGHRLRLSGYQAQMFFGEDDVLVPAIALTRLDGIEIAGQTRITYHQIAFDRAQLVRAEGNWCETLAEPEILAAQMMHQDRTGVTATLSA
ncbi:MAG: Hint domain-containing protein [Pseudomonadota bacterium]